MATEVQDRSEPSIASLVGGIVNDVQDLLKQQMRLTRQEIEADLRKTKEPIGLMVTAFAFCLAGAFVLCLMVAHLLHWLGSPPGTDPSHLPLWASYAIASSLFLIAGGGMVVWAKKKFEAIGNPLRDTTQALKENIEWKTKTSPS
jgi:hypothetical protein